MARSALPTVLRRLADGAPVDIDTEQHLRDVADRLEECESDARQVLDALAAAEFDLRDRRQQLARDAVGAETLAVRIAWGLTRNAEFRRNPGGGIWARISVDYDGHPYSVTARGTDHDEARCRLRDAVVGLFEERRTGTAASGGDGV